MNIEEIVALFVRYGNRRSIDFPEAIDGFLLPKANPEKPYLLYLHIPFCFVLCPFCSFHRIKFRPDSGARYFESLRREIAMATARGFHFDELYVGGGTPTVIPAELAATIHAVQEQHDLGGVSIETNPNQLHPEVLQDLQKAGVTRLSVGVQSLDDDLLKGMQRYHQYGSGEQIVERLKSVRGLFETLNVDMIFNLPEQSETSLRRDLNILTADVEIDQVSFYPLMTSADSRAAMRKTMGVPGVSRQKDFYRVIVDHMLKAGYSRSSAWCFSRQNAMLDEYIVDRDEYVGLGSGAFSYLQGSLYANTFSVGAYMDMIDAGRSSTTGRSAMSARQQARYYLLMHLFAGSLDIRRAESYFDGRFQRLLRAEIAALRAFGAIERTSETLTLSERGWYLWIVLMREFFNSTNDLRAQMRRADAATAARN